MIAQPSAPDAQLQALANEYNIQQHQQQMLAQDMNVIRAELLV